MNDAQTVPAMIFGMASLLGSIFFIIGLLFHIFQTKKEKRCDVQTYGKVIDIIARNNDGSMVYFPKIEYSIGSTKYVKEASYGSNPCHFQIGQDLEVFYNPDNYEDYYIANDNTFSFLAKIFMLVGLAIFIIFGIICGIVFYVFR